MVLIVRNILTLLLYLLLQRPFLGFNIDDKRYSIIRGPNPEVYFGISVISVGDQIFVGAPNDNERKGALYSCKIKDFRNNGKNCVMVSLSGNTGYEGTHSINETGQGLGSAMALNGDKSKLTVCAPRRKSRLFSYCNRDQPELDLFDFRTNVTGVCYEINTGNLQLIRTLDYCKANYWRSNISTTNPTKLLVFGREHSCLQFRHPGTGSDSFLKLVYGGIDKYINFKYLNGTWTITSTHSTAQISPSCGPDSLAVQFKKQSSDLDKLFIHCNGVANDYLSLGFKITDPSEVEIKGFSGYWDGKFSLPQKEFLQDLDDCMLGASLGYRSGTQLVLTAPGYYISKSNTVNAQYGAIFYKHPNSKADVYHFRGRKTGDSNQNVEVGNMGTTYSTIKYETDVYEAVSGKNKIIGPQYAYMTQIGTVLIIKNNKLVQQINETTSLGQFGYATLFLSGRTSVHLLVSSPFTKLGENFDCGVVDVFTHAGGTTDVFEQDYMLQGSCGGFGMSLSLIGDINQDGFQDLAIGSPLSSKVNIFLGSESGLATSVSQIIYPEIRVSQFGYAISADKTSHSDLVISISDPLENQVYLYSTLPIKTLGKQITCNKTFNIDIHSEIQCDVCLSVLNSDNSNVLPQHFPVIKLLWRFSENFDISSPDKTKTFLVIADTQCRTVKFEMLDYPNEESLKRNLKVTFSFTYNEKLDRTVALTPASLDEVVSRDIDIVGICGDVYCSGDFAISGSLQIDRVNVSGEFLELNKTGAILPDNLYQGSGVEVINITAEIEAKEGMFIDEVLEIYISAGISVHSENCTMSSENDGICRFLPPNFDQTVKLYSVSLSFRVDAYLEIQADINMTVKNSTNREIDTTNNNLSYYLNISKLIKLESEAELKPNETSFHLSGASYRQTGTFQSYGPPHDYQIKMTNTGPATIDTVAVSVLYPVFLRDTELIYVGNITGAQNKFTCDDLTWKQINYKQFKNLIGGSNLATEGEKVPSLPLIPCSRGWQCINLTCFLWNFKGAGSTAGVTFVSYINAQHASNFPNFTYTINYTVTVFDRRSTMTTEARSTAGSTDSFVQIFPPLLNPIWYIVGAVIGASVLLTILVIILMKCGFFKRKKMAELQRVKLAETKIAVSQATTNAPPVPNNAPPPPPNVSYSAPPISPDTNESPYEVFQTSQPTKTPNSQ